MDGTVDSGENRHVVSDSSGKATPGNIQRVRRKKERVADPERDRRTVFIGNLPVDFKKKQLTRLCSDYGIVSSVRFRSVAITDPEKSRKVAVFKKEFSTDHPVKNAYVVFCEPEGAAKALELHNRVIEDRHIKVDLSSNSGHDYKATVFIGNLPRKVDDEAVRTYFETQCGTVDSVRLIRDASGAAKGFGYVKFADPATVLLALKCHKSEFMGRDMRIFKAKKNWQGAASASKVDKRPGFSGHHAKKGEKPQKAFQQHGTRKGKGKKPTKKAKEAKHMKKEKRMQNIDKRNRSKSRGNPKHS